MDSNELLAEENPEAKNEPSELPESSSNSENQEESEKVIECFRR